MRGRFGTREAQSEPADTGKNQFNAKKESKHIESGAGPLGNNEAAQDDRNRRTEKNPARPLVVAQLESQKGTEDATDQNSPAEKESEGDGGLEGMRNENISSHAIGDGDKSKPEMIFPAMHREDLDELKGATKHQNDPDKSRNGSGGDKLVTQSNKTEKDHGESSRNRPAPRDRRNGKLGKGRIFFRRRRFHSA
jgi:hypothetical protein